MEVEYYFLDIMADKKVSQSELSRRTSIPASTLNRYIKHGADMPVSNAKAIAKALGITVDELLGLNFALSVEEKELIACYRSATPAEQSALLHVARTYRSGGQGLNNQVSQAM